MRLFLLLIVEIFIFISSLSAQNLTGTVKDIKGEPIAGATIYIKEINLGILCNEEGEFQTTLKPAQYTVDFRCLGYETETKTIEIKTIGNTIIDIILKEKPFELSKIEFSSKEDPAYGIMRKVIDKAPYYAKAIDAYKAYSYIKGNAKLTKIAKLADSMIGDEDGYKLSDLKDKTFVQESFNEIKYTAPDKYEQKVMAFSSSFPDNLDAKDVMGIFVGSIYNEKFNGALSPLSKKSFSYYRFRYEGFTEEDGIVINKIKVISKVNDPQLYNGYLYIADNTWHVSSAELTLQIYGLQPMYLITYEKVGNDAYLPITYQVNFKFDVLGVHGLYDYYASLKYDEIKLAENIEKNVKPTIKPKKEFEIKWSDNYKVNADSLASKRDSSYWETIRVVPLKDQELISFEQKDSIQQRLDSLRRGKREHKFSFWNILSGGQVGNDTAKITFKYDGLFRAAPQYNFVDGVWLGQKFEINIKPDSSNHIKIEPYLYYAYSRKKMLGGGKVVWNYAPFQSGLFEVGGGSRSEDFNKLGIPRFNNSLQSLIRGNNKNFFYQKDFISVYNSIDIANGLNLSTSFEVAKRLGLKNHTHYTWGKKRIIKDNIYAQDRFDRTAYMIGLLYAPYAYYTKAKGRKEYVRITSPIFSINYREGFGNWQKGNSQFRTLEGGIAQHIRLGLFGTFNYNINGGGFLGNRKRLHFSDYHHFNTANTRFVLKTPFSSFMLLDNYEASANNWWIQSMLNYTDNYILLKRLPFLQGKLFTENLHLKNLYTPDYKIYTEVGYSVDFLRLMNFGIFASFRKGHYEAFEIRYGIDLNALSHF